ncbi:lytic transglycosylase domain-containing protein [Vogesella indigofera]|uniref:lytic transglycosylase domain-containing protein n=1 Tax=Vogesella indigofera TaxID=45465 RepID=UPI00234E4198|nr:lytic transglycosylase domain-containing protein [Vogesella indigofera]MDC7702290.1 lytic transglycosylase domain-containing protein [Vogesella indigofera]
MTNRLLLTIVLLLATSPVLALGPQPADDFLADAVRPGLGATLSFDAQPEPPPAPESRGDAVPAVKTPAYNRQQAALFSKLINQVAREHKLDPQLLHAIVTVESGYNPVATSPKGAQGLMQLMPDTAARFGVSNPADPLQSLRGGARYLRFLQGHFKQDMTLVIAAYNAGEGAVGKYRNTIPPYRETREYVAKVLASYESRAGQPLVPVRQPRFQLILPPPMFPL